MQRAPASRKGSAEDRGNSCQRKHPAEILALGSSCASHRRSSNTNSLCGRSSAGSPEICATFQRDVKVAQKGVPLHFAEGWSPCADFIEGSAVPDRRRGKFITTRSLSECAKLRAPFPTDLDS